MGRRWIDRGSGPNRRGGRSSRLPPPHVQRAHRAAGCRSSTAAGRCTGIRSPPSGTSRLAPSASVSRRTCSSSPYHHPLEIAKRYGTLDVVSNGRVILGVGVGTLKEEFDLIGAPFDDRGPRADDALKALRASLSHARAGVPRPVLRLRRARRRSVCRAGARADLGRGTDAALAPACGRARRRLVPVRGRARPSCRVAAARRRSVRLRGGPPADRASRPRQRTREDPGDPRRHRGVGGDDRPERVRQRVVGALPRAARSRSPPSTQRM